MAPCAAAGGIADVQEASTMAPCSRSHAEPGGSLLSAICRSQLAGRVNSGYGLVRP